ncbi:MAG: NADH-quinone oxidoreductase subunit NuoF [Candidatus Aminicenantes bacterium]|nr:NADH-quinone oxidoreductase subunit NuoF [Candidatus Aminicenantes bacterium]
MSNSKIVTLDDLELLKEKGLNLIYPTKTKISVGMATCGISTGAREVFQAISEEVQNQKLDCVLSQTGCLGFCQREPLVDVIEPGKPKVVYAEMSYDKVPELITNIKNQKIKNEWMLCQIGEKYSPRLDGIPFYKDVDFYKKQKKIALRNCGFINPDCIEEYIAKRGYFALHKVLTEMKPKEVVDMIAESGLRGRGGAGFLTGKKWQITRSSKGKIKYIICNADEGDPGAYMDRSLLEGDPHSVLEGMLIGAYAIGASTGYIYVRAEYPQAIVKFLQAVKQAEEHGLLGKDIFNSGFNFEVRVNKGAGAFVCGEETALIASIEGGWSGPRPRPPFPAKSGLWGKPTNINNVETWANVPVIIDKGADWYSKIGTEKSKGTKVFSVVGKVNNTGLVEVPMGITLREIVYDIGGGILDNRKFKAVQTGGPSGGCIPESLIDLPVDFEKLTEVGSMMGSGGMIVMDENTCMVDVAKYFLAFLEDESCGKCVPCREGIEKMREILNNICKGEGEEADIELLEEIALTVKEMSLCGLGQTASNPVLTTIKYFRNEYEEHIINKRCPAGVCLDLISYSIDAEKCNGCGACVRPCPTQAITGEKKKLHSLDQEKCIKCGACYETCKFDSIIIK